jgi:hypothetical protein
MFAAIVSLAALVRENLYLLLLGSVALVVVAVIFVCCYILLARVEPVVIGGDRYFKYRRYRLVAIATLAGVGVTLIVLLTFTRTWHHAISIVFDPRAATAARYQLEIAQLELGASGDEVSFDVTVRISLSHAVLVKRVVVRGDDEYAFGRCCCPAPSLFKIGNQFRLVHREQDSLLFGRVAVDGDEYLRPVRGRLIDDNCSSRTISAMFDTSIVVNAGEYSNFRIVMPRSIGIAARTGNREYRPIDARNLKSLLVQCVIDRPSVVLAASIGPMPSNATHIESELDWSISEAIIAP